MRHPYLLNTDRRYQHQLSKRIAKASPESPRKQTNEAASPIKRDKHQITSLDNFQLLKNKDLELIMKLTNYNKLMKSEHFAHKY